MDFIYNFHQIGLGLIIGVSIAVFFIILGTTLTIIDFCLGIDIGGIAPFLFALMILSFVYFVSFLFLTPAISSTGYYEEKIQFDWKDGTTEEFEGWYLSNDWESLSSTGKHSNWQNFWIMKKSSFYNNKFEKQIIVWNKPIGNIFAFTVYSDAYKSQSYTKEFKDIKIIVENNYVAQTRLYADVDKWLNKNLKNY